MMHAAGGLLLQTVDPFAQWPVIGLVVTVLGLAAGVVKWFWEERKKEIIRTEEIAEKQRVWQSSEADKQRIWQEARNKEWQAALFELESRRDQNDEIIASKLSQHDKERADADHQNANTQLQIAEALKVHHEQARTILEKVTDMHGRVIIIERNTQPRNQANPGKGSSRGAG